MMLMLHRTLSFSTDVDETPSDLNHFPSTYKRPRSDQAPPSPAASAVYLSNFVSFDSCMASGYLFNLPGERGATIEPSWIKIGLSKEVVGSCGIHNGEIGISGVISLA